MSQKKVSKKESGDKFKKLLQKMTPMAVSMLFIENDDRIKSINDIRIAIWVIVLYLVFLTVMQPEVLMWIGENL